MMPGGVLTVVDPYRPSHLQLSMARIVARRAARHQPHVATRWLRLTSLEAAALWTRAIDLCVLDAVHTLEAVRDDWTAWSRFIGPGGRIVARNDVMLAEEPSSDERSKALVAAIAPNPDDWRIYRSADTFTAYERVT